MIAVDTNIMVYAYRPESAWHDRARQVIQDLAEGVSAWAIPWPCVHEFLGIVTHPRIYQPPSPMSHALGQIAYWLESPSLVCLGETADFLPILAAMLQNSRVQGPQVHDARIAAICHYHGVDTLYSADRDFSRFAAYVKAENPLVRA